MAQISDELRAKLEEPNFWHTDLDNVYPFRKPGEQRVILCIEPTHLIGPKD
jgi:hypothetical protein